MREPIDALVGALTRSERGSSARRDAAQVLEQHGAQQHRQCPHLAHRELRRQLEGLDELAQRVALEATVGMSDVLVSDGIHADMALEAAGGQRGQASIRRLRKHRGQLREMLGDDVEVIEQPLGRMGDGTIALHRGRERAIGLCEGGLVLDRTGAQIVGWTDRCSPVLGAEHGAKLCQPLRRPDLGAYGVFHRPHSSA